ncbi:MAG: cytochrome D1 domain-containing protein [Sulfuriferula sp.]
MFKKRTFKIFSFLLAGLLVAPLAVANETPSQADASALFQQHCAACHGEDRLGGIGPALLPENLERLSRPDAVKTIAEGRPATQMPAFTEKLTNAEIAILVNLIYTPLAVEPKWGDKEMEATHKVFFLPGSLRDKPVYQADPLNLFVVVESGDHHVTILDGDTFIALARFPSHFALHGGPKFSPHGRFVYFASRGGWITRYDLYNLKVTAEIRAGINTRNLAVSGDGKYVLVGNYLPHDLVLLNAADLSVAKIIPAVGENGQSSRVSAVYEAKPRHSFVVALKDVPEIWEIKYDTAAGMNTSQRPVNAGPGEADNISPAITIHRIRVNDYLDDFFLDPSYHYLIATARNAKEGQVVDLDSGKVIAHVDLPGMPHLGSAITWEYHGDPVFATPNLKQGIVSVIDMKTWKTVKHIKTLGPGFFIRSHQNTPYAWVDVAFGPDKDAMQVIDKRTLQIVATLRPEPGKTSIHTEFTRDGRYALVSIWEKDGALAVYDARTLKLVKLIPMSKPVGKYNVYNKITLSPGTSH